ATIELGKLPMSPTPLAVAELLQEAVEPLQSLAQQKEVALEVVHDRAESQIVGDRQRLHQVFSNLVGNALKFTPPRGKVVVRAEAAGQGDVRFAIEDSGPGIPEESRPHLFDRYWQAQGEYRRGTGLGLWIAKSIVEAHHGTIWVESNLGRGSTFFFTVPSIAEDQAQPTAQA
ncbi:MAG TPA: ATP-binding protein, partial [Myxococcaceae bacterium]|nr:ATP-binding protein [Myxococcaceae bacterium]